jgi:hypothetical protein
MKAVTIEIPDNKELVKEGEVYKLVDVKPITERVKTFEDAVRILGEGNELVREFNDFKEHTDFLTGDVMAYIKLRIVVAALNEGWVPSFKEDEFRWYPWFNLYTDEEVAKMSEEQKKRVLPWGGSSGNGSGSGLAYADSDDAWSSSSAVVGSRLALKSEELADYVGRQFIELYKEFMIG